MEHIIHWFDCHEAMKISGHNRVIGTQIWPILAWIQEAFLLAQDEQMQHISTTRGKKKDRTRGGCRGVSKVSRNWSDFSDEDFEIAS